MLSYPGKEKQKKKKYRCNPNHQTMSRVMEGWFYQKSNKIWMCLSLPLMEWKMLSKIFQVVTHMNAKSAMLFSTSIPRFYQQRNMIKNNKNKCKSNSNLQNHYGSANSVPIRTYCKSKRNKFLKRMMSSICWKVHMKVRWLKMTPRLSFVLILQEAWTPLLRLKEKST